MLDPKTVRTMIDTGSATTAHIAQHFNVELPVVEEFLQEHQIEPTNATSPQFRHIHKLLTAVRPQAQSCDALLYDDVERRYCNGIDTRGDGRVDGREIVVRYHGAARCWYTGDATQAIMAIDGNPRNILISNMIPISEDAAKRFQDQPLFSANRRYESTGSNKAKEPAVTLHLQARYDREYGAAFNSMYVDASVEQWLRPYMAKVHELFPGPTTAEALSLWIWRHLSGVALLKGLARIDVRFDNVESILTKDQYLQMVVEVLRRSFGERAIATPSSIVMPQQRPQQAGPLITA